MLPELVDDPEEIMIFKFAIFTLRFMNNFRNNIHSAVTVISQRLLLLLTATELRLGDNKDKTSRKTSK
jgi:hypothetical protein